MAKSRRNIRRHLDRLNTRLFGDGIGGLVAAFLALLLSVNMVLYVLFFA